MSFKIVPAVKVNDTGNTPYVLLYEKKALDCCIYSIDTDISILYDITSSDIQLVKEKNELIKELDKCTDIFKCYSINLKKDTYKNKIYEPFNDNLFIYEQNIIYLQINISAQNKENFKLLIRTLYYQLFEKNIKESINIPDNFKIKLIEFNKTERANNIGNKLATQIQKEITKDVVDNIDFYILFTV